MGAELPFENNLFVYLGLSLDGNKQNHKNAQDHSANKFNKYQVIASIPAQSYSSGFLGDSDIRTCITTWKI